MALMGLVVLKALADTGHFQGASLAESFVLVNEIASMLSGGESKGTTETGEADGFEPLSVIVGSQASI